MLMAVKQVGVAAVWAFRTPQIDSYFCPLTECIYSNPLLTLWIPGIDFPILKLNELYEKKRKLIMDSFSCVGGISELVSHA